MFPDKLRVSSFPDRFPHYVRTAAKSAHSNFVGSRVYACLGVPCHLHFWQNDRGLLRATPVTRAWHRHRIRVRQKVNSTEENSPNAPAGIRTRNHSMASPALLPIIYPRTPWSWATRPSQRHVYWRGGLPEVLAN